MLGAVVFGRVVEGYDVVDKVQRLQTNGAGRPVRPVRIVDSGVL